MNPAPPVTSTVVMGRSPSTGSDHEPEHGRTHRCADIRRAGGRRCCSERDGDDRMKLRHLRSHRLTKGAHNGETARPQASASYARKANLPCGTAHPAGTVPEEASVMGVSVHPA